MTNIKSFKSFITESDSTVKSSTKVKSDTIKTVADIGNIGFSGQICMIGFGAVGQDLLAGLIRHIAVDPKNITVIEKDNNGKHFRKYYGNTGVKYIRKEITKGNLKSTLAKYLKPGGFLVDVSTGIDVIDILEWTFENDVHYINTSLERYADVVDEDIPNIADRTLFHTHKKVRKFAEKYPNAATATVVSGQNPGCVSHYVKEGLLKIAEHNGKPVEPPKDKEGWAQLMKKLGVEVIHIAERDTQASSKPKPVNEFWGLWSCFGMTDEAKAAAEFGYGTHEPKDLENCVVQGSAAFLKQPGVSVLVKSWVPTTGKFNGHLIQHSESITLSEYFETEDKSFRPSTYYAYQPNDDTLASLYEFRGRELDIQDKTHILKEELISGIDAVGVLMITNKGISYWYGSILSIDEARKLIPGSNATTVQVVANMIGTMMWALENPRKGYVEPEYIDYDFILKRAKPYLGTMAFVPTDWRPEVDKDKLFPVHIDKKSPNSLTNFRVWNY